MDFQDIFKRYGLLVAKADRAFQKMSEEYGDCIECRPHCSDCCHAVFGLFLVESVYLKNSFNRLDRKKRRETIRRANKAERDLEKIQVQLQTSDNDLHNALSMKRIRCPLLDERDECILYPSRPITCRVYGVPVAVYGKARVCGKAGFKKEKPYPAFDLDAAYKELHSLAKELLLQIGGQDTENASLLVPVSRAITSSPLLPSSHLE